MLTTTFPNFMILELCDISWVLRWKDLTIESLCLKRNMYLTRLVWYAKPGYTNGDKCQAITRLGRGLG